MIRLSCLLFLVFMGEVRGISFDPILLNPSKVLEREHHFNYVYQQIRSHEGGYVFHPNDKGGETYGGIARNIHPNWGGWRHIDAAKPLNRYDTVEAVEFHVKDWYLTIWVQEGFENIEDKNLALNLFDFRIHSSPKTVSKLTSRVLENFGCKPTRVKRDWIDGRFNRVEPREFVTKLKKQRLYLFNYLVDKNPDQRVFLDGWKNRLENI